MKKIIKMIMIPVLLLTLIVSKTYAVDPIVQTLDITSEFSKRNVNQYPDATDDLAGWSIKDWQPKITLVSPRVNISARNEDETVKISKVKVPNFVYGMTIYNVDGDYEENKLDQVRVNIYNSSGQSNPVSYTQLSNSSSNAGYFNLVNPIMVPENAYMQIQITLTSNISSIINNYVDGLGRPNKLLMLHWYIAAYTQQFDKNNQWVAPTLTGYPAFESEIKIQRVTEVIPPEEMTYTSVGDLPATNKSLLNTTNVYDLGSVVFSNIVGRSMIATVNYNNDPKYVQFNLASNTDMSIFSNTNESYYYTIGDEKFILINHANESMFTSKNITKQNWINYTIWNLTTNEINTFDRYNTYIYVRNESANNVYAYFYVDNFVMDQLLSVSLAFRYQYKYMIGNPGEWQEVNTILEAGVSQHFDPTSWQADFLAGAAVVTGIGAMIPAIRWPVLLVGTVASIWVGSTINTNPFQFGAIEQIQQAHLTVNELSLVNQELIKADPDFAGISNQLNLYKLHLGQYNKPFATGIDIDNDYSLENNHKGINIIQFTYMTQGQIYTIDGKDINPPVFVEGDGVGDNTPGTVPGELIPILIGLVIGVLIIISGVQNGAFVNRKGFNLGGTIGVLIAAILVGGLVGFIASYIMGMFIGSNALLLVT